MCIRDSPELAVFDPLLDPGPVAEPGLDRHRGTGQVGHDRAWVEERIKDSKLGMALRHLPSGYAAANEVWMWAAFLALSLSAALQALTGHDQPHRAHAQPRGTPCPSPLKTITTAQDQATTRGSRSDRSQEDR